MTKLKDAQFVLVTRKTRLQELVERFNTWPQAKFYLEHSQVDAQDYLVEHDNYQKCIHQAETCLKSLGRLQVFERSFLSNYQFSESETVIVVGQDGLVANTLKYLNGQPVVAVNPDPDRFDGKLLPFGMGELESAVIRTVNKDTDITAITFAEATTNDGQKLLAVNDLFIGPRTHSSARYEITWNRKSEVQSSSGIIVSTGFGSSGWFQSILAGAMGVMGEQRHELTAGFPWNDPRLFFAVREPFPSKTSGTELVFGAIDSRQPLKLESHMPENGVIFSDGIESDYISFNSGSVVAVGVSRLQGQLVMS